MIKVEYLTFFWQFCLLEIADVGFPVEFGGQNPCSNWYAKVCPPWPGILWPVDQLGGPLGWCWRFAAKGSFRRREELKGYQNWEKLFHPNLVGHYFRMSYHQRRGKRVCFCLIRYHYWLGRGSHPRENPWHLRWSNFH